MPQNESIMLRPHGHPLLCFAEMAEWNRLATVRPNGLIEWRWDTQWFHRLRPVPQDCTMIARPGMSSMKTTTASL